MGLFKLLSRKSDTTLSGVLKSNGMTIETLSKKAKVAVNTLEKHLDTEFDEIPARSLNKIKKVIG